MITYIIVYLLCVYLYMFICTRKYYKTLFGSSDFTAEILLGLIALPSALPLAIIRTPKLFELSKPKDKVYNYYGDYEWGDSVIVINGIYKDNKGIVVGEYNNHIKVVIEGDSTTSYINYSLIEPCFNGELAEELALLKEADKIAN